MIDEATSQSVYYVYEYPQDLGQYCGFENDSAEFSSFSGSFILLDSLHFVDSGQLYQPVLPPLTLTLILPPAIFVPI